MARRRKSHKGLAGHIAKHKKHGGKHGGRKRHKK